MVEEHLVWNQHLKGLLVSPLVIMAKVSRLSGAIRGVNSIGRSAKRMVISVIAMEHTMEEMWVRLDVPRHGVQFALTPSQMSDFVAGAGQAFVDGQRNHRQEFQGSVSGAGGCKQPFQRHCWREAPQPAMGLPLATPVDTTAFQAVPRIQVVHDQGGVGAPPLHQSQPANGYPGAHWPAFANLRAGHRRHLAAAH